MRERVRTRPVVATAHASAAITTSVATAIRCGTTPAADGEATPAAGPGLDRQGRPLWSATRLDVAEKLWGEGFVSPGSEDYLPTLVKPLGLNPAMSVLDLGAGLGGTTRLMAKQFGAWVTGLESSPLLVKAGMERSYKLGLVRQAPIQAYDPEAFRYPKRVDAVFAKEAFFTVIDKAGLLDNLVVVLKPRGQVLFTDYVTDPGGLESPALASWAAREPVEPIQRARVGKPIIAPHDLPLIVIPRRSEAEGFTVA